MNCGIQFGPIFLLQKFKNILAPCTGFEVDIF